MVFWQDRNYEESWLLIYKVGRMQPGAKVHHNGFRPPLNDSKLHSLEVLQHKI